MGRSDPLIMPKYIDILRRNLPRTSIENVVCLGQPDHNAVSRSIPGRNYAFFDRSLGNWDINGEDWPLEKASFDVIVCTRYAYFSASPGKFIGRIRKSLRAGGVALVDWGLGDHWRYPTYRVGWFDIETEEHENAYDDENFLWSCMWRDEWESDPVVSLFWDRVKSTRASYARDSLSDVVSREVPCIINYDCLDIEHVTLWEDSPQLYTLTIVGPKEKSDA